MEVFTKRGECFEKKKVSFHNIHQMFSLQIISSAGDIVSLQNCLDTVLVEQFDHELNTVLLHSNVFSMYLQHLSNNLTNIGHLP